MLQVNTSSTNVLSQANLENLFSSTARFNALTAIVDGTSSSYVKSSISGAQLPVITGAPSSPTQGAIWYDTSDHLLKYRTGLNTTVSLGTGSGSVSSVGLTAPTELAGCKRYSCTFMVKNHKRHTDDDCGLRHLRCRFKCRRYSITASGT